MQRRNLVVKSVTAFVEAAQALRQRAVDESPINVLTISRRRSRACLFQQVDQPSGIAIGKTNQTRTGILIEYKPLQGPHAGALEQQPHFLVGQRIKHIDRSAG